MHTSSKARFSKLNVFITTICAAAMLLTGCSLPFVGVERMEIPDKTYQSPYAQWPASKLNDPNFFPIMVWAQNPSLAPKYKQLGVNTYMALWGGPTAEQLADLSKNGMYAICAQNEYALENLDSPTILAWMHGDEPDNYNKAYKGPVPLDKLTGDYLRMISNDPTRPVLVNFGQGLVNGQFKGRVLEFSRYPLYCEAADILSFDVYPVANLRFTNTDENGNNFSDLRKDGGKLLWYVAEGIDRLKGFTDSTKPVWNVLECTAISNPRGHKVTPHQMRAEVWMSIVHGSRGICWFCHDFREGHKTSAAILGDEVLSKAMVENNMMLQLLAPVINSPDMNELISCQTTGEAPVDTLVKVHDGSLYIFAVCMQDAATGASVTVKCELAEDARVEVLGEQRYMPLDHGSFVDDFDGYGVHLYKIPLKMDK